ncbi:MAG TPA: PQQ-binding-like beta-propeller repeat protein, partial [Gammaproteobacteria bacterium]|nr:PQQ-binding-like beta-propeller repeat protein [Gammaproteobacteria bacterium]
MLKQNHMMRNFFSLVAVFSLFASCSPSNDTATISVATGSSTGDTEVTANPSTIDTSPLSTIRDMDWELHNLDLFGSRFSPSDQITPDNVASLTPKWLFQHGVIDGVSNQTTPVIVDEIMYVTDSRGSVYAVDANDGHLLWIYDVTNLLGGGRREGYIFRHRGVTYEDGVVYTAAGSFIFALDAITGEPLEGFGEEGQAPVILDVLHQRDPSVETAISVG